MTTLDRRHVVLAGAALLAGSAQAQTPARKRPALVAIPGMGSPEGPSSRAIAHLKARLAELGWREPQDIRYEVRWARGQAALLPALVQELLALQPDVVWTAGAATALAARAATSTVPIVFSAAADPVALGLARSLARPGGNATGLATQMNEYMPKSLQLLQRLLPGLARVGFLAHFDDASTRLVLADLQKAAAQLRVSVVPAPLQPGDALADQFVLMLRERIDAVIVNGDLATAVRAAAINELLARHRLPALLPARSLLGAAGVMSFGIAIDDLYRRSAEYIDRILRGAKAAELPIEQPTRFELVINQRAARSLGLVVPAALLLQADEVIE